MQQVVILYLALLFIMSCSSTSRKYSDSYSIYYPPIHEEERILSSSLEIDTILKGRDFKVIVLDHISASKIQREQKIDIEDDKYRIQFSSIATLQVALEQKKKIEKRINQEIELLFEPPFYKLQLGGFLIKERAEDQLNYFNSLGVLGFVIQNTQ